MRSSIEQQFSFAGRRYQHKRRQKRFASIIEPYYSKADNGRWPVLHDGEGLVEDSLISKNSGP